MWLRLQTADFILRSVAAPVVVMIVFEQIITLMAFSQHERWKTRNENIQAFRVAEITRFRVNVNIKLCFSGRLPCLFVPTDMYWLGGRRVHLRHQRMRRRTRSPSFMTSCFVEKPLPVFPLHLSLILRPRGLSDVFVACLEGFQTRTGWQIELKLRSWLSAAVTGQQISPHHQTSSTLCSPWEARRWQLMCADSRRGDRDANRDRWRAACWRVLSLL